LTRQIETAALLAPRYNRAIAALLFSLTRSGLRGDQARIHMLRGIGAVAALGWAISSVRGETLDEMVEHYDPNSNKFFTWEFAGQNLGPGTKIRSVMKLAFDIMEDPGSLGIVEEGNILRAIQKNPGLRFLRGNLAPISGRTPLDLLVGQDFIGDPTRDGTISFTKTVGRNFMPIWLASTIWEGGTIPERVLRGGIEFVGGRAYPQNLQWEFASEWRIDLEPYFNIATTTEGRAEKGQRINRLTYRERNPMIDAKLFLLGRVSTVRSARAKFIAGNIVMDNLELVDDVDESTLKAYKKVFGEAGLADMVVRGKERAEQARSAPTQAEPATIPTQPVPRLTNMPRLQPELSATVQWERISREFNAETLGVLADTWEGKPLSDRHRRGLMSIWRSHPLGTDTTTMSGFNTWLKQKLRQLQTNAAVEVSEREQGVTIR
jgi:hypothetical protein